MGKEGEQRLGGELSRPLSAYRLQPVRVIEQRAARVRRLLDGEEGSSKQLVDPETRRPRSEARRRG